MAIKSTQTHKKLHILTMKKKFTGTLTPRPSMICRKLNYKGKINPDSTVIEVIHVTPNIEFGYDIENGKIEVTLNQVCLLDSLDELKRWMKDNKIPFRFEGESMFFIDTSDLDIQDIEILESVGFVKKQTENENSINYIWEIDMTKEEQLLNEIFRPMTLEEKQNCDGFKSSNCCGEMFDFDTLRCTSCKDHATNECSDCEEHDCPNRIDL